MVKSCNGNLNLITDVRNYRLNNNGIFYNKH